MHPIAVFLMAVALLMPGPAATASDEAAGAHNRQVKETASGVRPAVGDPDRADSAAPSPAVETPDKSPADSPAAETLPAGKKRKRLTPDPNRRWIMKDPAYDKRKIASVPRKPVEWQGAAQQTRCQGYAKALNQSYLNARYYSVQGDRCKTAHYSAAFLKTADMCRTGCPETYMESLGFDNHFIRNMQQLKALGSESCLGNEPPSAATPAPKP